MCDMWSLGVILYMNLSGKQPFWENGQSEELTEQRVRSGIFDLESGIWRSRSANSKDLLKKLLTVDPNKRITIE